jgi:hypothetical protein
VLGILLAFFLQLLVSYPHIFVVLVRVPYLLPGGRDKSGKSAVHSSFENRLVCHKTDICLIDKHFSPVSCVVLPLALVHALMYGLDLPKLLGCDPRLTWFPWDQIPPLLLTMIPWRSSYLLESSGCFLSPCLLRHLDYHLRSPLKVTFHKGWELLEFNQSRFLFDGSRGLF